MDFCTEMTILCTMNNPDSGVHSLIIYLECIAVTCTFRARALHIRERRTLSTLERDHWNQSVRKI